MANAKLDLALAVKIVDKFEGDSLQLGHFLETIDLLKIYSENVAEADIIIFLKTRLMGTAHGSIEGAATLEAAKQMLRAKFAIKLTPTACEAELKLASQRKMTIAEFGKMVEQLAARLATAHVAARTFPNEAAADAIVQPAAISAFISGLSNPQTAFFVRARNPPTLNRAISDALEVLPINKEEVNWYQPSTSRSQGQGYRGRFTRGNHNPRGRGYGYNQGNHYRNYQNNNNYQAPRGNNSGRGRGNRGQFRQNHNNNNRNRSNQTDHSCNCTQMIPERENTSRTENQTQEEVNALQELFRE